MVLGTLIGGTWLLLNTYKRSVAMQNMVDRLILRAPIFGDVIRKANGRPVVSSGDLPAVIVLANPGDKLQLEVWRKGAALQTGFAYAREHGYACVVTLDADLSFGQLRRDFDAVFLGLGAQSGRPLPVEGGTQQRLL